MSFPNVSRLSVRSIDLRIISVVLSQLLSGAGFLGDCAVTPPQRTNAITHKTIANLVIQIPSLLSHLINIGQDEVLAEARPDAP
jgi:hypothetical protein